MVGVAPSEKNHFLDTRARSASERSYIAAAIASRMSAEVGRCGCQAPLALALSLSSGVDGQVSGQRILHG